MVVVMKIALTRLLTVLIPIAVAGSAVVQAAPSPGQEAPTPTADRALLDRYCVACHSDALRTAGLTLQGLDVTDVGQAPAVWEKGGWASFEPAGCRRPGDLDLQKTRPRRCCRGSRLPWTVSHSTIPTLAGRQYTA